MAEIVTFADHKFCAKCGRVLNFQAINTFDRRTGEPTVIQKIKQCPNYQSHRGNGDGHDRVAIKVPK